MPLRRGGTRPTDSALGVARPGSPAMRLEEVETRKQVRILPGAQLFFNERIYMQKLVLERHYLKAALLFVSKDKDGRRISTAGVCVQVDKHNVRICATNGHLLFVAHSSSFAAPGKDFELIIPADIIVAATTIEEDTEEVSSLHLIPDSGGVRWKLGDVLFTPIQGIFPRWDKCLPKIASGEYAQYQTKYLKRLERASKTIGSEGFYHIAHNGFGPAAVTFPGENRAFAIAMPYRIEANRESLDRIFDIAPDEPNFIIKKDKDGNEFHELISTDDSRQVDFVQESAS